MRFALDGEVVLEVTSERQETWLSRWYSQASYGGRGDMAWSVAGTMEITAGEHSLELLITEPRALGDGSYNLVIDALALQKLP